LQERGLTAETIQTFGLGFCNKGVMQNRVAIPVHNGSGQLVAYAGRWPGDDCPNPDEKYKLPKGFRKTLEVFNLHRALQADATKPLIVVEGFFGCMKLWQAGHHRVVSVMGSSVSEQQESAIMKASEQSRKIVLLFDEDKAGREGREKALQRFASKAYVRVIALGQEGMQPDKLAPEQIHSLLLEEAPPGYGTAIPKLRLGRIVSTPNALEHLTEQDIALAIGRHSRGDWGELDDEDKQANERALIEGTRLLSVYRSASGVKFYVITEHDRSATTILLPEDY
jgi:5S rRNA maturation endonuclease (ribonuclease M5)